MVCAHLIYGTAGVLDAGITFSRRIHLLALMSGAALTSNCLFNWVLIPHFGFMGPGYSIVLSMLVYSMGVGRISGRIFPINIEWRRLVLISTFSSVGAAAALILPASDPVVGVASKLLILGSLLWAFFTLALRSDERQSVVDSCHKVASRFRRARSAA